MGLNEIGCIEDCRQTRHQIKVDDNSLSFNSHCKYAVSDNSICRRVLWEELRRMHPLLVLTVMLMSTLWKDLEHYEKNIQATLRKRFISNHVITF